MVSAPSLGELASLSGGTIYQGQDVTVEAIGLVAQELAPGALFAAVPGTRVHGATFAADTEAAAILTDEAGVEILQKAGETRPILVVPHVRSVLGKVSARVFGDPSQQLTMIGITGTSGKTTTSYLLEAGLMAEGHKVGLIGTTGTRIDGMAVPTKLTTPEAPKLQELFAQMRDEGVTHVVMEVSSHAIALGRVAGTHFTVGAFTNLSQDHLDFHHSMEEYFEAKAAFFRPGPEHSVVCVDDVWGRRMAEVAGVDTLTVSTDSEPAAVTTRNVVVEPDGSQRFEVLIDGAPIPVHLPVPGAFNVANAALALAAASAAGSDPQVVAQGMSTIQVPGRMEKIDAGQDFLAVVDYAHKPAAVAAVLDTLRQQATGRIGVVLGAGGDRDAEKRPLMGTAAAERADLVIITDDNPRSEDPELIRNAIVAGTADFPAEVRVIGDRAEAIRAAVSWAGPGDAIVIAGKGHETGQLVNGVTHHFDDREELLTALKGEHS